MNYTDEKTGASAPEILMPAAGTDLSKWSVVACDQYTSEPAYWEKVEKAVGKSPSVLRLIYPEVYLGESADRKKARVAEINGAMKKYLESGILKPLAPGFVYVDRMTSHAASRKGLVLAVDLEKYDFSRGSKALIRATENTIVERIPPRLEIRKNAPLELSHVMLLIDDPEGTVIEPLAGKAGGFEKLYDFKLMMDGGSVRGWRVSGEKDMNEVFGALAKLAASSKGGLLFAVGDGNHSLATAKTHWENLKKAGAGPGHPARRALVEVVNIHDKGLAFEPIHRLVFNVETSRLLAETAAAMKAKGVKASPAGAGMLALEDPAKGLAVAALQEFLDAYISSHKGAEIDYIHGGETLAKLVKEKGGAGILLPALDKGRLFGMVAEGGTLPRKTFSMGEAEEKRFYLEARKITEG